MKSQKEVEELWLACRTRKKALVIEREKLYNQDVPTERIDQVSHEIEIEEQKMDLLKQILEYK